MLLQLQARYLFPGFAGRKLAGVPAALSGSAGGGGQVLRPVQPAGLGLILPGAVATRGPAQICDTKHRVEVNRRPPSMGRRSLNGGEARAGVGVDRDAHGLLSSVVHAAADDRAVSVRAAAIVASPSEVLAEAVANSLDAGATEINADLDLAAWSLRVLDNGCGIPPTRLGLLGRRCMPPTAAGAVPPLGYRGEALAAVCAVAEEVEVISRAAGSFETHRVLFQGGLVVHQGLALEQRSRQGTAVTVRGVFFNQPVRRKALLSDGLVREVERCKQACLQLVLLRPEVTLTCFDRSQKAFLLRLIKGRSQHLDVALFLGQEQEHIAAMRSVPGTAPVISGYAAMPPHGQPNASRQLVLLNGRSVSAPPVCRLMDEVFAQLYKPNMRLQHLQAGALLQVHRAANLRAAFVLHISCDASQYELAHEAGAHLVQFASWGPLLQVLRHSLLAAWQPVLSNSLLTQLELIEGSLGGVQPPALAQATAQHSEPAQDSFEVWLEEQRKETAVAELGLTSGWSARGDDQHCKREVLSTDEPATGREGGSASAGQRRGSRQQLAGAKRALTSQLVRYSGSKAAAADDRNSLPAGESAAAHLEQLATEKCGKRARAHASAPARHISSPACGMQQQGNGANAPSAWVLAGQPPRQGQQIALRQHDARPGGQSSAHSVLLQSPPPLLWQQPGSVPQHVLPPGPDADALVGSWGVPQQSQHMLQELKPEQAWRSDVEMSDRRTSEDGKDTVEDLLGSWRPLRFGLSEQQGWQASGWAEAGTLMLQDPVSQTVAYPSLLPGDHVLLELSAAAAGSDLPADSGRQAGTSPAAESVLSLEAVSSAAFAELKPATLTRQHLAAGRVLQQVDSKFLAVASGSILLLVDQHAADERVQLERLRDQLLSSDGQPGRVQSQVLRPPLLLGLTDAESQLLEAYTDRLAAWGWRWQRSSARSVCGSPETLLTQVPLLWGTALTATDLTLYLHQLHDTFGSGALPPAVVRVLNSKACRSAIMFGDRLQRTQCQELLVDLAQSQLCFSCAHGRPTAAPLVDLQLLRRALHLRRAALLDTDAAAPGTSSAGAPGLLALKSRLLRMLHCSLKNVKCLMQRGWPGHPLPLIPIFVSDASVATLPVVAVQLPVSCAARRASEWKAVQLSTQLHSFQRSCFLDGCGSSAAIKEQAVTNHTCQHPHEGLTQDAPCDGHPPILFVHQQDSSFGVDLCAHAGPGARQPVIPVQAHDHKPPPSVSICASHQGRPSTAAAVRLGTSQYSFSLTTFSPSGKLVQIEYALTAVNAGATSLGIRATNGVVLATEKKLPSILVDETTVQKMSMVTPNVGMTYSGMGPDSRVLVRKARKSGQVYFRQYHEQIPVAQLCRETAAVMQEFTQSGGVRPFGVSLLMAGFDDNGPQLYQIDPSGSYFAWKASAIGKNMVNAKTFLEKRYSEDMELEDAIHTALLTLKEGFEGELSGENIEVAVIGDDRKFRVLTPAEVQDYLQEVE
ncbi:Proteasome subunit alpha type-2 [Chlorella vulgaris]